MWALLVTVAPFVGLIIYMELFMTEDEKELLYTEALDLMNKDDYEDLVKAYKRFIELGDYKESQLHATACKEKIDESDAFVGKIYGKRKKVKRAIIATLITVVVLALGYYSYSTFIVREMNYRKAVELYEKGDYVAARAIFEKLGKYKQSASYMKDSSQKGEIAVGSTIYFGSIEQDNDGKDEYIEWIILDIQDNKALLISKYAIYNYIFDDNEGVSPWSKSLLRKWLNADFILRSFTKDERLKICQTTLTPDKNPYYEATFEDESSRDDIFVLSAEEMEKYLDTPEKRKCYATPYALFYGAVVNADTNTTFYWTRTQGSTINNIVTIDSSGDIFYSGSYKTSIRRAVRPAMWIDITDFIDKEHDNPDFEDFDVPEQNKGDYIN